MSYCLLFRLKRKEKKQEEEVTPETLERDIKAKVSYRKVFHSTSRRPRGEDAVSC